MKPEESNKQFQQEEKEQSIKQLTPMKQSYMRWIVLALACNMMFGYHIAYEFPAYLKQQLKDALDINNTEFGLLYSVYSLPNIILPFIGGFVIDRFGVRLSAFVFSSILIFGQAICSISIKITASTFIIMLIGRGVFAIGGENVNTAQNYLVNKWFYGKELAFSFGILLSVGRLGSGVAGLLLPYIYNSFNNSLFAPLMAGVVSCSVSLGTTCIALFIDLKAERQENGLVQYQVQSDKQSFEHLNDNNNQEQLQEPENQQVEEEIKIKFDEFKNFESIFWLLTLSCVLNYICLFVFLEQGQDFLIDRYQVSADQASFLISLPYWIAAGLTPFIGLMIDRIGKRQYFILFAAVLIFIVHFLWIILPQCPEKGEKCNPLLYYSPLIIMGVFYSCYAAVLWPCFPLILLKHQVGMGFGVVFSIQNLGLFIGPLLAGYIQDSTQQYRGGFFFTQIFYMSSALGCIITAVFIIYSDKKSGFRLNNVLKSQNKQKIEKQISFFQSAHQ